MSTEMSCRLDAAHPINLDTAVSSAHLFQLALCATNSAVLCWILLVVLSINLGSFHYFSSAKSWLPECIQGWQINFRDLSVSSVTESLKDTSAAEQGVEQVVESTDDWALRDTLSSSFKTAVRVSHTGICRSEMTFSLHPEGGLIPFF